MVTAQTGRETEEGAVSIPNPARYRRPTARAKSNDTLAEHRERAIFGVVLALLAGLLSFGSVGTATAAATQTPSALNVNWSIPVFAEALDIDSDSQVAQEALHSLGPP